MVVGKKRGKERNGSVWRKGRERKRKRQQYGVVGGVKQREGVMDGERRR